MPIQQRKAGISMSILQTTDLKKYYGAGPAGNLDSKTSAGVPGLLKRISGEFNQTIVMITHNSETARLADRIVRIEDGKIKA